jgi:hypothetical protein
LSYLQSWEVGVNKDRLKLVDLIDSNLSGIQNLFAGSSEYPFNIDFSALRNTAAVIKEDVE